MPEREDLIADPCALAARWGVELGVLVRLIIAAIRFRSITGRAVQIISGFRSAAEQLELERSGRPAAPDELSTHRSCPATGIDVSFSGVSLPLEERRIWGALVIEAGLRWGGGSRLDDDGVPIDWQHVDRGPRER